MIYSVEFVSLSEIDEYMITETDAFALDAYRYNTDISNTNSVLVLKVDDIIKGCLYYRWIDNNVLQLVNIYSLHKGGGTMLFNFFYKHFNFKYMFFYMSNSAESFYSKYNITYIEHTPNLSVTFVDNELKSCQPDEYRDFIRSKINKLKGNI